MMGYIMTNEAALLLELVQVGLSVKNGLSHVPSSEEWKRLFRLSHIQAVTGLAFDGVQRLGEQGCKPPFELLMEWIGLTEKINNHYEVHRKVLKNTLSCLVSHNIDVAFMKGLVVGSRYPKPEHRQCGDIDFIVAETDFTRTLNLLESIGKVDRGLIHEHHGMAFVDGVQLEPHYKVHNFQNPSVDKAMKEMFNEVFPDKLITERIDDADIPTFPPAFECAFLVSHMVNHVYAEGLGLRQLIDFMMFLNKQYSEINSMECLLYLKRLKMERAFRIFVRSCEKYLGLSKEIVNINYSSKEIIFADKMMEDIMEVGNFGRGKDYLGQSNLLRPVRSYLWVTSRCIKLGYLCPAEAKWWPISKIRRYWWKRRSSLSRK